MAQSGFERVEVRGTVGNMRHADALLPGRLLSTAGRVLLRIIFGFVAFVTIWQLAILIFQPPAFIFPTPQSVAAQIWLRGTFLLAHTAITFAEAVLGLLAGAVVGCAVAIGVAALPRAGRLIWPMILIIQALPVFAIAPLLVIWFGFGLASKIVMTALITFFPVASAFGDGIRRTDSALLDVCALTDATHGQVLRLVRIPLAMPYLIAGLKVAAPLAPLGAVVGEWVGGAGGLGFIMLQANARMQTADVFAALFFLSLMTLVLRAAVDLATGPFAPWARESTPGRSHLQSSQTGFNP